MIFSTSFSTTSTTDEMTQQQQQQQHEMKMAMDATPMNDTGKASSPSLIDLAMRLDKVMMECHALSLQAEHVHMNNVVHHDGQEEESSITITNKETNNDGNNDSQKKNKLISQTLSHLHEIQEIVKTNPDVLTTRCRTSILSNHSKSLTVPSSSSSSSTTPTPSSKPSLTPCQSYHHRFLASPVSFASPVLSSVASMAI